MAGVMEATHPPGWTVWAHSEVGLVRRRNEDSWVVVHHALRGKPGASFGVFDGLGGLPRGLEAAEGARLAWPDALRRARRPEAALKRLNEAVMTTGGATTGVVAVLPTDGDAFLVSAGDSSAYALVNGEAVNIAPHDAGPGSMVTDHLGNPGMRGHVTPLPQPGPFLLCTDGVDRVIGQDGLRAVLEATDAEQALEGMFKAILAAGAPDNATAVLARRADA